MFLTFEHHKKECALAHSRAERGDLASGRADYYFWKDEASAGNNGYMWYECSYPDLQQTCTANGNISKVQIYLTEQRSGTPSIRPTWVVAQGPSNGISEMLVAMAEPSIAVSSGLQSGSTDITTLSKVTSLR